MRSATLPAWVFQLVIDVPAILFQDQLDSISRKIAVSVLGIGLSDRQGLGATDQNRLHMMHHDLTYCPAPPSCLYRCPLPEPGSRDMYLLRQPRSHNRHHSQ